MRSQNVCQRYIALVVTIVASVASVAGAAEPLHYPADVQEVLQFVPASTECVFCVNAPIKLRRWDDLHQLFPFQTAVCFTTMLAQRGEVLFAPEDKYSCVISAIRNIKYPKRDPARPVVDGPFQSQRCEFYLVPQKLPASWIDLLAKASQRKLAEVAGQKVLEITLPDETLLVGQVSDRVFCIANDSGFLKEALQLTNSRSMQKHNGIDVYPLFRQAASCISLSADFWGIRLFNTRGAQHATRDPTTIHNEQNVTGVFDRKAIFVTIELTKKSSMDTTLCYASEDADKAFDRFVRSMAHGMNTTNVRRVSSIPANGSYAEYVVDAVTIDLTKVVEPAMDEPSILFLAICTLFGQGMLL
jgi:hypothetical protein